MFKLRSGAGKFSADLIPQMEAHFLKNRRATQREGEFQVG